MNTLVDRCDLCGGVLQPGYTTLEIWRGENLLVIRDVPADVCQQCHEAYLSPDVSERLDHFLLEHHQHRPERYLAMSQYVAAQALTFREAQHSLVRAENPLYRRALMQIILA